MLNANEHTIYIFRLDFIVLMLNAVDDKEWVELDMSEPDATLEDNYIFDGSVVTFEEKKIKKQ